MDSLTTFLVAHIGQSDALLMQARQVVGLVAAVLAAMLAGQLGRHGTDRLLARRERADD
ncbi:hypothetical protein F8568_039480 [Actinomadura sp. LD22]|uniref:Uncharacterized protein n=1 Tax=Actinomadura physcomitrii TaxID=2650748 RepID=A0A6I4MQQ3_9ACTN|nr:hypothetical protein [Actinomadura physcomitrii]MWA06324.1 hypothetical protein [Actinomadura physcomitrii]